MRPWVACGMSAYSIPRYDGTWSGELPVEARTRQPVRTLGLNFSIPLLGGPPTCAEIWAALPATSNRPAHLTDAVADNLTAKRTATLRLYLSK